MRDGARLSGGIEIQPTPTINDPLPARAGDFDGLVAGLEYAARGRTGYNFYSLGGELSSVLPYSSLRDEAVDLAARLARRFPRLTRIGLISETMPDFPIAFYACQYAGLVPVPLPLPMGIGGKGNYLAQVRRMMRNAGASALVASEDLLAFAVEATEDLPDVLACSYGFIRTLPRDTTPPTPLGGEETCYIQYSSGSTTAPKGVISAQHAVVSNCGAIIRHGARVVSGDRCGSWLPLYHDMGLVGFMLTPMMCQLSVDYIETAHFARRPLLWLDVMSRNRATIGFSPSFGYDLCQRRAVNHTAAGYDLSRWRIAGIGGDIVRADVLERFAATFKASGFRGDAFTPSYGLAEATLAVTFSPAAGAYRTDTIDIRRYSRSGEAVPAGRDTPSRHRRTFVNCGRAFPDHTIALRDGEGRPLGDRKVGRILVKGPSVAAGYFRDPEATAEVFDPDGWLDTGDLGYTIDGDVVVTGRSKDLILWNGRNIWPQDIEWAVEALPGVRGGAVAAFSVDGTVTDPVIVTLVECRLQDRARREELVRKIAAVIHSEAGVPSRVVLTPPHSLVMTSSGKLSRAKVKEKYLAGEFFEEPRRARVPVQVAASPPP